jgi:RNA polymerase sigma-70 factor (ECF subfamily)
VYLNLRQGDDVRPEQAGKATSDAPEGAEARARTAAQLMARYCDGDAEGCRGLYALLAPRLLGYLKGLVGERAAAEDLLQQTFLKLHEARAGYVRGADPVPWIYTIAHRTCLDELRRRRRARGRMEREANEPEVAASPGLDETEAQAERYRRALAALDRLPESQREALLLTKVHGRTHAEAAAITGSTPGAIKLRAHRAYVALRALLGEAEQ